MKKQTKIFLITIVCIILFFAFFFPYIKAEFLTLKHGNEFKNLQRQTNVLTDTEYYKVISYSDNTAKVFYVSDSGDLLTFKKDDNDNWKYYEWKTIWSTSGSASEFMWPYYH